MLVLSRAVNERICIGDADIELIVTVVGFSGGKVRLGIEAPARMYAMRGEFAEAIRRNHAEKYAEASKGTSRGASTGTGGAAALSPPEPPDGETLVKQLFAGDPDTRKNAARELGIFFKASPDPIVLAALAAALRQEQDSSVHTALTVSIKAIAGKKYLDELLKTIKNGTFKDKLPESPTPVPSKEETVKALLTDLPDGYDSLASEVDAINQAYRRELAGRLIPALKAKIQAMPSATYGDKKELAQWVNAELRRFGLAIKSPKSDRAATFSCDAGNHPEEGRFRLVTEGDDGKKESFSTPRHSELLDNLVLIDAPLRREGLAGWHSRAGRERGVVQRG